MGGSDVEAQRAPQNRVFSMGNLWQHSWNLRNIIIHKNPAEFNPGEQKHVFFSSFFEYYSKSLHPEKTIESSTLSADK